MKTHRETLLNFVGEKKQSDVFILLVLSSPPSCTSSPEPQAESETSLIYWYQLHLITADSVNQLRQTPHLILWVCLHSDDLKKKIKKTPPPFDIPISTQRSPLSSVEDSIGDYYSLWALIRLPAHLSLLSAFKHLWLWCHHCETTALFPLSSFVILCFWKIKEKKKDSFTYKNKPCKNVGDSYFIYPFSFSFCKQNGWDLSLFSGHPTAFCILTNKDLF